MMSTIGTSSQLSPQLSAIVRELEDVNAACQRLVAQLSPEKIMQRPAKGGWSVAECINHLTVSTGEMIAAVEKVIPNAPKGEGPYKMDVRGKLLMWFLEPPYRVKFKAVPSFEPRLTGGDILGEFLESQKLVVRALERCNHLALDKAKVISPVDSRMSYNAYAALKIIPAHERRHLWQAQKIAKDL